MRWAAAIAVMLLGVLADPALAGPPDRDGDGIADSDDACPGRVGLEPGGCPPSDRDGDGSVDRADDCPGRPGPVANRGCPDRDRDGDGYADRADPCPDRAGADGCPIADGDTDGVADDVDRCKGQREVWNGTRDGDGCPDPGEAVWRVDRIVARTAVPIGLVSRRGSLDSRTRLAARIAASLLRAHASERVRLVVVADYGLSYGDSIDQAGRIAEQVIAIVRAGKIDKDLTVTLGGPDGDPRLELHFAADEP